MTTRRNFLKKAAAGTAAVSAIGGFSVLSAKDKADASEAKTKPGSGGTGPDTDLAGWQVAFEDTGSVLSLRNDSVAISGELRFFRDENKWTVARSRDGLPGRYALIDGDNNVQGYIAFHQNSEELQLLFYHRTAQMYEGKLSFEGKISFPAVSFPCRTRANADERVLSLCCGQADSLLNDSLFAPESDASLQLDAAHLQLRTESAGTYSFAMSGQIGKSSEAAFTFNLERNYFKDRYIPYYHPLDRKRCPKAPSGWMSWNTYFDKATAADNLAEAKIGQKYLLPFGCEIWSIESWQGNSDHLPVSDFYNMDLEVSEKKFPKGMRQLAGEIRKLGFRPGLWTAPFGTGNKEFYEKHKDWFLHDTSGKPLSCWNGRYTLDPTAAEAREHLKKIHATASRDWGYEFFKIDGMSGRNQGYCAHFYERPEIRACFKDPTCPNPFELCVKALREGIGEDRLFLACQGHTTGPEVLYADASRIGADIVEPDKPVQWHGVYNQGRCFLNQAFTHNIVMIADPDTLLVHDLPEEEARVSATVIALPGQLTFFGDKLAGLSPEQMKLLQQTLPVADVHPVSLYPYTSMLPVWNLHVKNKMLGHYNIVALFNWKEEAGKISFTTGELGIDSDTEYILYEFWTKKGLGIMKDNFSMDVPAHGVRLVAVHEKKLYPRWISSDRHIAQNALELKEYKWNSNSKAIEGTIHLIGTFPITTRFHVPEGYIFREAECRGTTYSAKDEGENILAVTLTAEKTGDYGFSVMFKA